MNRFIENATRNLLSNSKEKIDYIKAIKEWSFTGEVIDNNEFIKIDEERPSCELCKHEDLRWQFTINNQLNNKLKVGSTCIKQFDIVLINEYGNRVYGKERDRNVEKAITKKRDESEFNNVLETLRNLWRKDKETKYAKNIAKYGNCWKENKALKPLMLAFIIYRLNENKMEYKKLKIKMDIKKFESKRQLKTMEQWKYELIKPYLSIKKKENMINIFVNNKNCT
jgi:hypothetical protein